MSGQAFLSEAELSAKVASIEYEVVKKEWQDFYYHLLLERLVKVIDRWMGAGRPISDDNLMEATKIREYDLRQLYRICPQLVALLVQYRRHFGSRYLTVMGRAGISGAQQKRHCKKIQKTPAA